MTETVSSADQLRTPSGLFTPDPRNASSVRIDESRIIKPSVEQHRSDVSQFILTPTAPESVQVKFETAKNLYLYSWFVYRFFPVAEHQALACLEHGLRKRFSTPLPKKYWTKVDRPPTLKPLLRFAIDEGFIKNDWFRRWHNRVEQRARERYEFERIREMIDQELDLIEIDYELASPNEEDRDWDFLAILLESLPEIRNAYAHGSPMLHKSVLGTIELVGEILNQLFLAPSSGT